MANCTDAETIEGVRSKLGFAVSDTASPPTDPTEMLEIDRSFFGINPEFLDTSGIRGTEAKPSERYSEIAYNSPGGFECRPTALDLAQWIPRIVGGTIGTPIAGLAPYLMAESRPCWDAFDRNQSGNVRKYRQNRVMSAQFSASEKQALSLTVQSVGETRDAIGAAYTWPVIAATVGKSFHFPQLQLLVAGTAYRIYNFQLSINYGIDVQFMNSATATAFPSSERSIMLAFMIPWKREALFESFRTGPLVTKLTLDFGSGAARRTIEWEMIKTVMANGNKEPGIPGKPSIPWNAALEALYDATDADGPAEQLITRLRTAGDV